jgi:hypothetical protein
MEAKHLRIGNKVLYRGEIKTISAINYTHVCFEEDEDRYFNLIGVEPVPITEDWLRKFDFYNGSKEAAEYGIENTNACEPYSKGSVYVYNPSYTGEEEFYFDWFGDGKTTIIKSVHQLQNLYWSLVGEELTIKSTISL